MLFILEINKQKLFRRRKEKKFTVNLAYLTHSFPTSLESAKNERLELPSLRNNNIKRIF